MHATLIDSNDRRWTEILSETRHDVYHLPAYVEFGTRWHEPGTPAAFVAEEDGRVFFVPLIVRHIPRAIAGVDGWLDATGPRGYPGPIVGPAGEGDDDDGFVSRAIACMATTLEERRIVSAFIRCHPLLSPRPVAIGEGSAVVEHGESVSIDLGHSPEQVWSETRLNHRRAITRALRDGYRVRIDESWQHLEAFLTIYATTMDRIGAAAHWRLPREYVSDLQETLGSRVHLCVVEQDGALAAAALLTEVDGIVEYHLSGTSPDHAAASPTKLLIDQASRWAHDRGDRVFHLAGSVRRDDPLIQFKRGFSPLRHPTDTWNLVTNPGAYGRLVASRDALDGRSPTPPGGIGGFFPAYRRPELPAAGEDEPDLAPQVG
jgi:hypothetical protein